VLLVVGDETFTSEAVPLRDLADDERFIFHTRSGGGPVVQVLSHDPSADEVAVVATGGNWTVRSGRTMVCRVLSEPEKV